MVLVRKTVVGNGCLERRGLQVAAMLVAAVGVVAHARSQSTATVDPNLVLVNRFEGWGTSLCWWANVVGGYSNRLEYASLAFSTLKLNIVRYNIGGGENPAITNTMEFRCQMPGFEPSSGTWDWDADQNQRWMLKEAVALGADRVVAFANSPPWWMTVSGSVTGSADGTSNNLQTSYESEFADYLATVVSNLTVLDGIHFDYVTPINEPMAGWWRLGGRQEGCHMDADQQARVVTALRSALDACGLGAGIDASEDSDEQNTINSINAYGAAQADVALIATHTYGANNPVGIRHLAASLNKPAWISEYGDNDATGMQLARRIHDDLTGTLASAWINWQFVDSGGGWGCLYNPLDGSGNTAYSFNRKFYVMGQFSQFIHPGCRILDVNDNNSLAAYHPTNQTLVIVALNEGTNALAVTYNLSAFDMLPAQVQAVRTSPSENQATLPPLSVTNRSFTASLAPRSVTTFSVSNAVPGPPGVAARAWYPLEGSAQDASGNGFDGALSNDVAFVAGKLGAWAAQFNGSNSFVRIPRTIANNFTIAFWVKTTDTGGGSQWWGGEGLVDGEVQGPTDDFGVSLVGGHVALGAGTPDVTVFTTNAVNDGLWHHIAATREATTGELRLYLDGSLQASGYGPVGPLTAPPELRIGSTQAGYSGHFLNGAIDDVQIFGRVFGPAEIGLLMNHPPSISGSTTNYNILAGRTWVVTNTATDPDLPAQFLSWTLLTPPTGAEINPTNGTVSWRPSIAQSPSTNWVAVRVTDNGLPAMAATQTCTVAVSRPQSPVLSISRPPGGLLSLEVSGDAGPDYIIQTSTNLGSPPHWTSVVTNLSASPPFEWADAADASEPEKFYRVILGP